MELQPTEFIRRPADREEWLRARSGYVGGSEAAIVLGLSPWKSRVDLYLLKSGRTPQEDEPTEAMRLGNYLEQYAADRYAEKTGRTVRNYGYMVVRGHAIADVDRLIVPDGEKVASHREEIRAAGILECKTARDEWDGEIPLHYQAQAQTYMELLNQPWVDFSVVFKSSSRHLCPADAPWLRLYRDRAVGARILEEIEAFWRSVAQDVPPEAKTLADAKALFPNARTDTTKEADARVLHDVAELVRIEADRKGLEEEADAIKGRIAAYMGEADVLVGNGAKLATFRQPKPRRTTDWKAVAADLARTEEPAHVRAVEAAHTTETPSARRFLLCAK